MPQISSITIFTAGLLTFASPCVLPLIPIHLSVLAGASVGDLKRGARTAHALAAASAFSLGLGVVFVLLGMAASVAGRTVLEHRAVLLQLGGLVVFLFGLKFLGYLRVPWLERDARPALERLGGRGGIAGGFVFGAAFGLGWTPCIGPILGSVLTYAASSGVSAARGAYYLALYAAGIAVPLLVTAAMAPLALRWHRLLLPHVRRLEVATGVLLAVFGLLLLTDQLGLVAPSLGPSLPVTTTAAAPAGGAGVQHGPAIAFADPARQGATCEEGGSGHGCALPDVPTAPPGTQMEAGIAAESGKPRLVEFLSRSCPICRRMEPVLQAAEGDCTGHGLSFVRVDVGTAAGRRAADEYRVRGVPTFVLLDPTGNEVARLVGEVPIKVLRQSLEVLAGEKCDAFRAFGG